MAERQSVRIRIFGTEYVLKGDSDPKNMEELEAVVYRKMRELGQPGAVQINRVAILTAFHFADELMKSRRLLDQERQGRDLAARKMAQLDLKIQEALHGAEAEEAMNKSSALNLEEAEPLPLQGQENPPDDTDDQINWK